MRRSEKIIMEEQIKTLQQRNEELTTRICELEECVTGYLSENDPQIRKLINQGYIFHGVRLARMATQEEMCTYRISSGEIISPTGQGSPYRDCI